MAAVPLGGTTDMCISDIRISRKIGLSFAAMVLGVSAIGAMVYVKLDRIETVRVHNREVNADWREAIGARAAITRTENSLRGYLLSLDPAYIKKVQTHSASFDTKIDAIRNTAGGNAQVVSLTDQAAAGIAKWRSEVVEKAIRLAADPTTLDAARAMPTSDAASALIDPVEAAVDGLIELQKAQAEVNAGEQQDAYVASVATLGIGIGLLTLVAISAWLLLSRGLARPIASLRDAMERLARGDRSLVVPALGRKDEVGAMAGAVEVFNKRQLSRHA